MELWCWAGIGLLIIVLIALIITGTIIIVIQQISIFLQFVFHTPEIAVIFIAALFAGAGVVINGMGDMVNAKLCISLSFAIGGWGEVPMPRNPIPGKIMTGIIGTGGPIIVYYTDWIFQNTPIP